VQPPVERLFQNRNAIADRASRVDEFIRLVPHSATITLVAVRAIVVALRIRTLSTHQTILQEPPDLGIKPLQAYPLLQHPVPVQVAKECLRNLLMNRKTIRLRCPCIDVETDRITFQSGTLLRVDGVNEFPDRFPGLNGTEFARGPVVVRTADKQ